jgi:hypothetical protein
MEPDDLATVKEKQAIAAAMYDTMKVLNTPVRKAIKGGMRRPRTLPAFITVTTWNPSWLDVTPVSMA